jgi:uncharacterized protein (TIGR00266 family)
MQVEVLHRPSYSLARVALAGNETLLAETGAMVGMSPGVVIDTKMRGGLLQSLARSAFGGESFFTNIFRAPAQGGEVLLAPSLPGDIFAADLTGRTMLVQSGSFLGCAETVEVDTKWSGARTFFGGEGLIMLRCTGTGLLILSSYGAIYEMDLAAGQGYTVDTGHLVAFDSQVSFRVRPAGGFKSTVLGGEGLVVDLAGPGKILLQTRSEGAFLNWLLPKIPRQHNSSGNG